MDHEHEAHLRRVKHQILELIDTKYRGGQAEHGGKLWLKPGIIQNIIEEIVDLVVYILTFREQYENFIRPEDSELFFTKENFPTPMCPNCGSDYQRRETSSNTGGFDSIQYDSGGDSSSIRLGGQSSGHPEPNNDLGGVYVGQPTEPHNRQTDSISDPRVDTIYRGETGS
jgi:hypothetical protein